MDELGRGTTRSVCEIALFNQARFDTPVERKIPDETCADDTTPDN